MAWLSGWSYRKEITITGQSGAGTNYQVKFNIGDSAGGDFHLEGHCTNFPQDIQITDNDGTTLLDYWIEDITADPLKMWVEVADDLGTNQTIYVYYGKSGATTDRDIEATFILGDDFPGTSIDTGKWTSSGTVSVSSSIVTMGGTVDTDDKITSISTFAVNSHVLEYRGSLDSTETVRGGFWLPSPRDVAEFYTDLSGNGYWTDTRNDGTASTYSLGTGYTGYHIWKIVPLTSSVIYSIDGAVVRTETSNIPNSDLPIEFSGFESTGEIAVDWVFIRKYSATEPAFSSAGSEETPPTGASPTAVFYGPLVGPLGGPI